MNQDQQLRDAAYKARTAHAFCLAKFGGDNVITKDIADVSNVLASLTATRQAAPYGYCPICGAKGEMRERRMDGNDTCANGHNYKSSKAVQQAAPSKVEVEFTPEMLADLVPQTATILEMKDGSRKTCFTYAEVKQFAAALLEASAQREQPAASNPEPQAQAGEPEVVAWCVLEPWLSGKFSAEDCFSDVALDANVGWVPLITLQAHREAMEKLERQKDHYQDQWSDVCNENQGLLNTIAKKDAALKACVEAHENVLTVDRSTVADSEAFSRIRSICIAAITQHLKGKA